MEENKENKKCCEDGSCEKCKSCCPMMACCMSKKHHALKLLVVLVGLIVVFCLGVQLGELKEEARSCHSFRGGMMDWDYKNVKPMMYNFKIESNDQQTTTPSTQTNTPTTQAPAKQ